MRERPGQPLRRIPLAAFAALAALLTLTPAAGAAGPTAIAADSDGTVYAGFGSPAPIQRFAGPDGEALSTIGTPGAAAGQLGALVALDVAPGPGGTVWALDANLRLQEFSRSGAFIRGTTLGACAPGISPDPLERGGLDVTTDAVFVAHPCADLVLRLRRSDLVQTASAAVTAPKGVSAQLYESAPPQTRALYVARPAAGQVALLNRTTLASAGTTAIPGTPTDVFVDAYGVLFVGDASADVVRQFGADGVEFRAAGGPGTAAGKLDRPSAIDVYEQFGGSLAGNVFVADFGNARVQRWNSYDFTFWVAPADSEDPDAPINSALPQIQGTAAAGNELTCTTGTWTNSPTSFGYAWARDGSPIGGATAATHTVTAADGGHDLTCTVTAVNAHGSGQATSAPVGVSSAPQPPVNVTRPQVDGVAMVNEELSCSQGTWNNAPTSFAFEWRRDGAPIGGAATSTYTIVAGDEGHQLRCAVTASNATGPATAVSDPVVPAAAAAPANTAAPQISGAPTVGNTISCSQGSWDNFPSSFEFEWRRDGVEIGGATAATHTVVEADVGAQLRCAVTASNATASITALSAPVTGAPAPVTPASASPPEISGVALVGRTLSCSTGVWLNEPMSYTWNWQSDGVDVASGATYVPAPADVGAALRCTVRAANVAGSATASSGVVTPGSDGTNPVGVSIAGGADYVAAPAVELTVREPEGATQVEIASSSDFAGSSTRRITADDEYSWTLSSAGPADQPRSVFVRFAGSAVDPARVYADEVILDEEAPKTVRAKLKGRRKGRRLEIRARDRISGIAEVDLAAGGGDNYSRRRFKRVIRGRDLGRIVFVRAIDGAGNQGNWVRVRRRHG